MNGLKNRVGVFQVEWSVSGRQSDMEEEMSVWGVTSDGLGHLFVCDYSNKSILMFSTDNGQYLGTKKCCGKSKTNLKIRVLGTEISKHKTCLSVLFRVIFKMHCRSDPSRG